MKLRVLFLVAVTLLAAFAWTFVKRPLPVPGGAAPVLPDAVAVEGVSLSIIRSAHMESQEGFSVRGGSLMKSFVTGIAAFAVEHPGGLLLVDAGMGRDALAHFATTPLLMQALATLMLDQPTADALEARGLGPSDPKGIILTHAHWDHVSGLADLRGVEVWMTPEELAFARSDLEGGKLYRQLEADEPFRLRELTFPDGAYGPFPESLDFYGDGSVIVVPMPGHTPGSVAVLVTEASEKRSLIIGDTAWTKEGVEWPAEKPWIARRRVDADPEGVRRQLVMLHRLEEANPRLVIVPAHDARVHRRIQTF